MKNPGKNNNFHSAEEEIKNTSSWQVEVLNFPGREGTLGCLLNWSPKFYNNIFLFVGLTLFGTFIKFWLVSLSSWMSKLSTLICDVQISNFVYCHCEVYQYIGHCLFPLDPCKLALEWVGFRQGTRTSAMARRSRPSFWRIGMGQWNNGSRIL